MSFYDLRPTIEEIDKELREVSDATIARYAAAFDPSEVATKPWEALEPAQRRATRANNEQARRQREKERAAEKSAEHARIEAQHDAAKARIAVFRQQARAGWIGDQASFDAAFPKMLEQWQIDQARDAMEASKAAIRERVGQLF